MNKCYKKIQLIFIYIYLYHIYTSWYKLVYTIHCYIPLYWLLCKKYLIQGDFKYILYKQDSFDIDKNF